MIHAILMATALMTQTKEPVPNSEVETGFINRAIEIFKGANGDVTFDSENRRLVIKFAQGGSTAEHHIIVGALNGLDIGIKVNGPCWSACASAIELSSNRCLTKGASLGYHMVAHYNASGEIVEYTKPELPVAIVEWVNARGGFPEERNRLAIMPYPTTFDFYTECSDE